MAMSDFSLFGPHGMASAEEDLRVPKGLKASELIIRGQEKMRIPGSFIRLSGSCEEGFSFVIGTNAKDDFFRISVQDVEVIFIMILPQMFQVSRCTLLPWNGENFS
jgi:hypothetical protein